MNKRISVLFFFDFALTLSFHNVLRLFKLTVYSEILRDFISRVSADITCVVVVRHFEFSLGSFVYHVINRFWFLISTTLLFMLCARVYARIIPGNVLIEVGVVET